MSGAGFYTAYAISMLNTLVGNLNVQGGLVLDAGPFGPFGPGPRYDFANFDGKVKPRDRKSTRLNSSHLVISYAVFCLKKKKKHKHTSNRSAQEISPQVLVMQTAQCLGVRCVPRLLGHRNAHPRENSHAQSR